MIRERVEEAAREIAGNWKTFDSFAWHREYELDDADNWGIVYTSCRDSNFLDQSNEAVINEAMLPFTRGDDPDVVFECHRHWGVGHLDGFSIRAYRAGVITPAFHVYADLLASLEDCTALDEEDYHRREYEATLENIRSEGRSLDDLFEMPDGWEAQAFTWLWDNDQRALDAVDGRGGYPSRDQLIEACRGLGYAEIEDEE